MVIGALEAPYFHRPGSEFLPKVRLKIPFRARPAAEYIQAQRAVLREGVAGDVRFLQQREAGDAAAGELVPARVADRMEIHFADQAREQSAEIGRASCRERV